MAFVKILLASPNLKILMLQKPNGFLRMCRDIIISQHGAIGAIKCNKSLTLELEQMITKGLIDQNYKILIRENRQINTEPSPDKISFTNADESLTFVNS